MITLFDSSSVEAYYIVKLSTILQMLVDKYSDKPDIIKLQSICWQLYIVLEDYYYLEDKIIEIAGRKKSIVLQSLDNLTGITIQNNLRDIASDNDFSFKLIERNSPYFIEISLSILPLLLLILNSLRKSEITSIKQEKRPVLLKTIRQQL